LVGHVAKQDSFFCEKDADMRKVYTDETGVVQVNLKIERDAKAILDRYAPGPRAHGRLIARLLFEHAVRQEAKNGKVEEIQAIRAV
jgi:hypothetical protein